MSTTITAKKQDKSGFFQIDVDAIRVAPENDLLYDRFGIANTDDWELAASIQQTGIQEPLTISEDNFVLSGHRRLAAAKYIGLATVPVRVADGVVFATMTKDKRLEALRLFNRQREKSPGERIKEKLLDVNPQEAHAELVQRRLLAQSMAGAQESNVELGAYKNRPRITTLQFLDAVKKVVAENKPYWPLTDRRIHYLLLNDPPLRHDKKQDSCYENDKGCYKAVTDLLLRARLTGDIPWAAIEDSTRPVQLGRGYSSYDEYVAAEMKWFLTRYSRDLMQGQPRHIEIVLEKNALRTIVNSVANDYCIPVTTGRGFASLPPRFDVYKRYRQSGKSKLVLLFLTDFDSDGEQIASSFARSMRDDFGIEDEDIHRIKVALTADDVKNYDLPSDMDAKESSPNYEKFIAKYGTKVVELDAAPVTLLQSKLREAIHSVIDIAEFNAQVELEQQDEANVTAFRKVAMEAINGGRAA